MEGQTRRPCWSPQSPRRTRFEMYVRCAQYDLRKKLSKASKIGLLLKFKLQVNLNTGQPVMQGTPSIEKFQHNQDII